MSTVCSVAVWLAVALAVTDDSEVKELIGKLKNPSPEVRIDAVRDLEQKGKAAQEAVPSLIKLLRNAEQGTEEYSAVVKAVERIGLDKSVMPTLLEGIKGRDRVFAESCWRLLSLMGHPALEGLIEAAKDTRGPVRFYAVSALTLMKDKPAKDVLPILTERLKDSEDYVRSQAGLALATMGAEAEPAVPALIKSLKDKNLGAAIALERVGPGAKEAVPALIRALGDTRTSHTINMHSSSEAGKVTQQTVTLAEYAASALGKIGPEAKEAAPELLKALHSPVEGLRLRAIEALGDMGNVDRAIVPSLLQILLTPQSKAEVQRVTFGSLRKLGSAATPAYIGLLRKGTPMQQEIAATQLSQLGEGGVDALADLVEALKSGNVGVRGAAATALGAFGPYSRGALPALRQLAKADPDNNVRVAAATAVSKIAKK